VKAQILKLLTPTEAGRLVGLSQRQVLGLARQGLLESVRVNARVIRIAPSALQALAAAPKR